MLLVNLMLYLNYVLTAMTHLLLVHNGLFLKMPLWTEASYSINIIRLRKLIPCNPENAWFSGNASPDTAFPTSQGTRAPR